MSDVIQFPPTTEKPDGGCPRCGNSDGFLNIHKEHWGICHKHRVKWPIGYNLYSIWQHETEATWLSNQKLLSGYEQVKPVYPKPNPDSADNDRFWFMDIPDDQIPF